jgi:hypothetical protein
MEHCQKFIYETCNNKDCPCAHDLTYKKYILDKKNNWKTTEEHSPYWKTCICVNYLINKACKHGKKCTFIHDERLFNNKDTTLQILNFNNNKIKKELTDLQQQSNKINKAFIFKCSEFDKQKIRIKELENEKEIINLKNKMLSESNKSYLKELQELRYFKESFSSQIPEIMNYSPAFYQFGNKTSYSHNYPQYKLFKQPSTLNFIPFSKEEKTMRYADHLKK